MFYLLFSIAAFFSRIVVALVILTDYMFQCALVWRYRRRGAELIRRLSNLGYNNGDT